MADSFDLVHEINQRAEQWWPFEAFEGTTEIADYTYATPTPQEEPIPYLLDVYEYVNDTDGPGNMTWSATKKSTSNVGWQILRAVSFSQTVTLKFPLPFGISTNADAASVQAAHKEDITTTESRSKTYEQTWSYGLTQGLPTPRARYEAKALVREFSYSTSFSARAIITGRVKWLQIGFGKPDQIRYENIGDIFTRLPNSRVTVLSTDTISVEIDGVLSGKCGRNIQIELHQYPLK